MSGELTIVPVTLRRANEFVTEHHRHHRAVPGAKFCLGVCDDVGQLRGVAIVGRPVARHLDDGLTAEVNRTCTDGTPNANSALYGAAWRTASAMGYRRLVTYTQRGESGASLTAAGWQRVRDLPARKSWAESSVALNALRDPVGSGGGSAHSLGPDRMTAHRPAPEDPMTESKLPPPFPLDDATLLAIDHALDASLTCERPDDTDPDDAGPWLTGASYSLSTLLDFLAGATGRDPNEELIQAGRDESDLPEWERNPWAAAEIVYDTRPHYSEHDLIRALVDEVRRLREAAS